MTEKDILNIIEKDQWMMDVIRTAEKLQFPDWVIGAGFVRNKVWDYLHDFTTEKVSTSDIDLVYFDPNGNDQKADEKISQRLRQETGLLWEIVNQAYAHTWTNIPAYTSIEDALSRWPETATAIGVRLDNNKLRLIAPYGVDDLVHLVIRPSPKFRDGIERVRQRAKEKGWLEKWPKLKIETQTV